MKNETNLLKKVKDHLNANKLNYENTISLEDYRLITRKPSSKLRPTSSLNNKIDLNKIANNFTRIKSFNYSVKNNLQGNSATGEKNNKEIELSFPKKKLSQQMNNKNRGMRNFQQIFNENNRLNLEKSEKSIQKNNNKLDCIEDENKFNPNEIQDNFYNINIEKNLRIANNKCALENNIYYDDLDICKNNKPDNNDRKVSNIASTNDLLVHKCNERIIE